MWKIWRKRYSVLITICVVLAVWYINDPPEPRRCALCDHIKCHAPCLVNLSTGEVGEVTIYEPHRKKVGEVAEEQEGGTLGIFYAAGVQVTSLAPPWTAELSVPAVKTQLKKSQFCNSCRKLLRDMPGGYVLADLYAPDSPAIYPIQDGQIYNIRCYQVSIEEKFAANEFRVIVAGLL